MSDEHVTVGIDGGVAVVTLNRPEKLNTFTGRMGAGLGQAYADCDADETVRAVVVTGAGRAFCAGADLDPAGETFGTPGEGFTASPVRPRAWEVRKPVIAAVNGHAIGIGLTLAMQCDIRLVAEDAKLAFAHVRRGVLPDAQSHWTVPRSIGFARATDLLLTGRTFTGEEAAALGLVSRALPAADVLPAAHEIAARSRCTPRRSRSRSRSACCGRAGARRRRGRAPGDRVPPSRDGPPDAREGVLAAGATRPAVGAQPDPRLACGCLTRGNGFAR